jgi:hypothetical protein
MVKSARYRVNHPKLTYQECDTVLPVQGMSHVPVIGEYGATAEWR